MATLPADALPPKSKLQPYYAIHPTWSDVVPIPQADTAPPGQPNPPALATIAYTPRYAEAMSYLRAVMADNEFSPRCLALTEDLIQMNPAHYTVWGYRMAILKGLWGADAKPAQTQPDTASALDTSAADVSNLSIKDDIPPNLWTNIQTELTWLSSLSAQYLKNYQIWQHRHSLVELLPTSTTDGTVSATLANTEPPSAQMLKFLRDEQRFLARILSLDTKNYHVWSYRQWLCSRFPNPLILDCMAVGPQLTDLKTGVRDDVPLREVDEIGKMLDEDVRNNSAWSHRYFVCFGWHELACSNVNGVVLKKVNKERMLGPDGVGKEIVEREVKYTMEMIELAPQSGSGWNYLRGIMGHAGWEVSRFKEFCEGFLGEGGDLWKDQWEEVPEEEKEAEKGEDDVKKEGSDEDEWVDEEVDASQARRVQNGVRSSHAVEWLSEIYAEAGEKERAVECLRALMEKWDIIRRNYWAYRVKQLEEQFGVGEGKQ